MTTFYLYDGVWLSHNENKLVIPIHRPELLQLTMSHPETWSKLLRGIAHQVKRPHIAKFVFLALEPREDGCPSQSRNMLLSSLLEYILTDLSASNGRCFVIMRNKPAYHNLIGQIGDTAQPPNLTITKVGEFCHTRNVYTRFVNHVIVDECVSAFQMIDKSQDNKMGSGRRQFYRLVSDANKVIMVNGIMSSDCDPRNGLGEELLDFLDTIAVRYSHGALYR